MLSYVRLNRSSPEHFALFCTAFRQCPSYIYASEGRIPTEDELRVMFSTSAPGIGEDDIFVHGLFFDEQISGCSFVVRGYPKADTAYLVLLLLAERIQNQGVGAKALRKIEEEVQSWGCNRIAAMVDSANSQALRFWEREGFKVTFIKELPGLVGKAVNIERDVKPAARQ